MGLFALPGINRENHALRPFLTYEFSPFPFRDIFQLWHFLLFYHFLILTLSNSEIFSFWHIPTLTVSNFFHYGHISIMDTKLCPPQYNFFMDLKFQNCSHAADLFPVETVTKKVPPQFSFDMPWTVANFLCYGLHYTYTFFMDLKLAKKSKFCFPYFSFDCSGQ